MCFVVCQAAPQTAVVDKYPNGYPTKFDNINLDGILNSKRLLSSYVVCLTEGKNCSPEGRTLKGKNLYKYLFGNILVNLYRRK